MLEKDAPNFLERTSYQYINIRRDWSGKGVNGEVGSDETTEAYFGHVTRGSAKNLALTVLGGSIDGLHHQGRPKRQWMDDPEEWSGCSYIQLKEMSQDKEQWRRKTIEWPSAVANRHRRWSSSE